MLMTKKLVKLSLYCFLTIFFPCQKDNRPNTKSIPNKKLPAYFFYVFYSTFFLILNGLSSLMAFFLLLCIISTKSVFQYTKNNVSNNVLLPSHIPFLSQFKYMDIPNDIKKRDENNFSYIGNGKVWTKVKMITKKN